jgi:hypothetical protein
MELQKENVVATLPLIKKGIIAGLFSLDYSLAGEAFAATVIALSSESSTVNKARWTEEYSWRKTRWRQDQITQRSLLASDVAPSSMPVRVAFVSSCFHSMSLTQVT